MIAFACSVSEPEAFHRYAGPGIELASEGDSAQLIFAAMDSAARSLNLLLDAAAACADLEALVIVHPHAQISDPRLCDTIRATLADPEVAVVGCAGATGIQGIAWWEGAVSCGRVTFAYTDHGGGTVPAYEWTSPAPAPAEVDAVDGFLLVLSPWAVQNLRFDEELVLNYGIEVDFCLQARAAGKRVLTADFALTEHLGLDIISDPEIWVEANIVVRRKWAGSLPHGVSAGDPDIRLRARRAEAELECARTVAYFRRLTYDARVEALERVIHELELTPSWRLTAPLRQLNHWRRTRAGR